MFASRFGRRRDAADARTPPKPDADSAEAAEALSEEDLSLLADAEKDLVAEMRNDMLRAQAELVNFRQRVERDRQANRDAVIVEVIRSLLPAHRRSRSRGAARRPRGQPARAGRAEGPWRRSRSTD